MMPHVINDQNEESRYICINIVCDKCKQPFRDGDRVIYGMFEVIHANCKIAEIDEINALLHGEYGTIGKILEVMRRNNIWKYSIAGVTLQLESEPNLEALRAKIEARCNALIHNILDFHLLSGDEAGKLMHLQAIDQLKKYYREFKKDKPKNKLKLPKRYAEAKVRSKEAPHP